MQETANPFIKTIKTKNNLFDDLKTVKFIPKSNATLDLPSSSE